MVNILGTPQWSFPEQVAEIYISAAGTGCMMRLGDMDGDGSYDIDNDGINEGLAVINLGMPYS